MRRLWLVFAQVVTATLAAIFVVSLVKPEWVPWRTNSVVEIRESAAGPATPAGLPGRLVSFSDAARKAVASVVNISATKQVRRRSPLLDDPVLRRFFGERFNVPETQLSLGSGVIVSREGFVLTNSHVVEGVTEIQVTLNDGRTVPGKIVGSDPETDLAVVRIAATGLTPITFGQSDQARVGDIVLAIGDPFSVGQTVTMGIVSAVGREIGAANPFGSFIQTDAAINPGNSGGALVDAERQPRGHQHADLLALGRLPGHRLRHPGGARQEGHGADHRDRARSRAAGSAWRSPTSRRSSPSRWGSPARAARSSAASSAAAPPSGPASAWAT